MKNFLLISIIFSVTCFAQKRQGIIHGRIIDEYGQPLMGVTISIDQNKHLTLSNEKGDYFFSNILVGKHEVKTEYLGFASQTKQIEITKKNTNSKLNFYLKEKKEQLDSVTIKAQTTKTKLETQGFAINVIETQKEALQSVQVNELLDRSAGVRIRLSGGLGSHTHYSINGMSGNSVKAFIDGVPITNYGSSFSLNSIPPSMIKRIEVYKGVVPAHLSDDTMGGAINIVLNKKTANNLTTAISVGSFGTYKADVNGGYRNEKTGFTLKGAAFVNYADNDYEVWGDQVAVTLERGAPEVNIKAKRFHDRYRSQGGNIEVGYTDVKWADKLLFGTVLSRMDKQIQTGATMEVVYGNRATEQNTQLFSLDYAKKNILKNVDVRLFTSLSKLNRKTIDTIATQYSWLGRPTHYYSSPDVWATGAEAGNPTLQKDLDQTFNIRANIQYRFNKQNKLQFNHLMNDFSRTSDDPELPAIENALQEERDYRKNISSLSFENTAFDKRLKTNVFAKSYHMDRISNTRIRTGNSSNSTIQLEENNRSSDDIGYGGVISFALMDQFSVFGSAEKAVRLPAADEVFGNVAQNFNPAYSINPEKSNNYNFGIRLNNINLKKHTFGITTNGFIRDTQDLIMRFPTGGTEEFYNTENIGKVHTTGIDIELNYDYDHMIVFSGNTSIFNARDYSLTNDQNGNPVTASNDRLSNTPYFTMNYNLRFDKDDLIQKNAHFSMYTNILYVHEFLRHGTKLGGNGKTTIPTQITTDLGAAYTFPKNKVTFSLDIKNIFDRQLFDNYALQKPGRGFYGKLTYSIL